MNNIFIKGGAGTGKTVISRAMAYYIGNDGLEIDDVYEKDIDLDINKIESFIKSDRVEYIQVHPSMTYEELVYGIEVNANEELSMKYAEKRIKQLCDRALSSKDKYFVILDDIGRTNAGGLLGNLLYAMEYRNQAVSLCDGTELIVPENVYFIITDCGKIHGEHIEYAIRRRFDYEKELLPSVGVLERYYKGLNVTKEIVINVYSTVKNFIYKYLINELLLNRDIYVPGHGMFMVEKDGSETKILLKIKQKFMYQVFPYIVNMVKMGILIANENDLHNLYDNVINQINVGDCATGENSTVEKILFHSRNSITTFGLNDSKNYYLNSIIPNGCKEHRTIIETIIDAILTNKVFSIEKALSDILLNTTSVKFEHRTKLGIYAAYMVDVKQNMNYGYLATSSNGIRSYYSSNPCKRQKDKATGKLKPSRWGSQKDAPAYSVIDSRGTIVEYIPLNAFRNAGFDVNSSVIHASENTASIYCALFRLIKLYLKRYKNEIAMLATVATGYEDIIKIIELEEQYWELKNQEAQGIAGADFKLVKLATAVINLRTLWNVAGTNIYVDQMKFDNLSTSNLSTMTASDYEDIYDITGPSKTIEIKGVTTMVDLDNYQKIMENIGVNQMIFQGPPGTSKTFESKKFVLEQLKYSDSGLPTDVKITQEWISNELNEYKLTDYDYSNPDGSDKLKKGGWDLVQFHPSYGYEDFIRGIEVKPINGVPTYSSINRILGKIAEFSRLAEKQNPNNSPKFYLIVDEINRANLATVFGELIYGLEYRNSPVSTPYEVNSRLTGENSKDIILGKNLFIIGTMNTADKSIDAIDYAIRRRFIFIDSPAKREIVLKCYQNMAGVKDEDSIELLLFDAIGYIFDGDRFFNMEYQRNDVRIGHTYFLRTVDEGYVDGMIEKFIFQDIPILREYVKDGIIDSFEDLKSLEHTVEDIYTAKCEDKKKMLGENIMLYVKHFGEKNAAGVIMDNKYIANVLEKLCTKLGF